MTLLKYGKYIEKLRLAVQAVHMQIAMIYIVYMWKEGLYFVFLNFQKFLTLALEHRRCSVT